MARIDYFDTEDASTALMAALADRSRLNIFRMIANSRASGAEALQFGMSLSRNSSLDPVHRELAILRVGHYCAADYELVKHTAAAARIGVPEDKVAAVGTYPNHPEALTEPERRLIDFVDHILSDADTPQDVFESVSAQYDNSQLVELMLLVGFYFTVCRIMTHLHLDLETEPPGTYRTILR